MTKHPNKTIMWKLKSIRNWFYDKWMRWRGYKPYEFNFKTNTYTYMTQAEIDAIEAHEEEPELEKVHYDTVESAGNMFYPYCDWENLNRKHQKLKELRRNA